MNKAGYLMLGAVIGGVVVVGGAVFLVRFVNTGGGGKTLKGKTEP